uniref:MFS transporter n=1 Tax=Thermosporothrix sp. COM3 TaxID=2490863 RepID=A0A455SK48_9CHLR|nr:MFS transporter [Thermosporothrix sp. COM3]
MSGTQQGGLSAWGPFHFAVFRALWIAALASNIGTWMQNVGAVWLMTSLTPSPLLVALMQTATSLPIFLVGLLGGALADVVDRRKLLLGTQGAMLLVTALLTVLTFFQLMNSWLLLILTFLLGLGIALNNPAWQAIIPELVPQQEVSSAVGLNSLSINLARAVGPALGGVVVALLGVAAVFLLNMLSFVGVILVLIFWRPATDKRQSALPAEHVLGAIRTGLRYEVYEPAQQIVLVRSAAFILFASALWALLPVVVKQDLGQGVLGYSALLAALGIGAVVGALFLPRLRHRFSLDTLLSIMSLLFALATISLAVIKSMSILSITLFLGGITWIACVSSLNVAAQTTAPAWVRARAIGTYTLVFQGGMAVGSTLWGVVASILSNPLTLFIAAVGLCLSLLVTLRWRFTANEQLDFTPAAIQSQPDVVPRAQYEDGPVLVLIEYHPDESQQDDFVRSLYKLKRIRLRDGAYRWGLFRDVREPGRYLESFVVNSWIEHLRQHERMVASDRALFEHTLLFRSAEQVSHFIAQPPPPK